MKKLMAICLALVLCLSLAPTVAAAETSVASESCYCLASGTTLYLSATKTNYGTFNFGVTLNGYAGSSNITTVVIEDTIVPTTTKNLFSNMQKLTTITGLEKLDISHVTDMSKMFYQCYALTSLDLSEFNTSNVTNMSQMFCSCYALTSLDLSKFNTSNVTNMNSMFNSCIGLKTLDVSSFNTSKVTDMTSMFNACGKLTGVDVSKFDTSNVTDMTNMFFSCQCLNGLDVSGFDTSKVTSMKGMFGYCSALTSLDVSKFNTASVTDMNGMFDNCKVLTSLDVSKFETKNVTDMYNMFNKCSGLKSLDVSHFNTSKVTDMYSMFNTCGALTSLDLSSFDTSKVKNMQMMLYGLNVTTLDVSKFDTSEVTTMNQMFGNCTKLTSLDLSKFNTSKVTNMGMMFANCQALKTLDLSGFDMTKVTSADGMFNGCWLTYLKAPKNCAKSVFLNTTLCDKANPGDEYTTLPMGTSTSLTLIKNGANLVTVASATGGKVEGNYLYAAKDTKVTFTVTPEKGNYLKSLTVDDGTNVKDVTKNLYVNMSAAPITVTAVFAKDQFGAAGEVTIPNNYNGSSTTTKVQVQVTGMENAKVEGLAEVATAIKAANTTKNVKVDLTVSAAEKTDVPAAESSAIQTAAGSKTVKYLSIDLKQTIGTNEPEKITNASSVLEILLPYDLSNKQDVAFYRYHDGAVKTFDKLAAATAGADGTFYVEGSGANAVLHVFTDKFSTYAIGYTEGGGNGGGHYHGGSTVTTVTSPDTADAGIALYGVLSVSAVLGMGWVSKKKH